MSDQQNLPIGVFDSGVGGLTVLRAMRHSLPAENFLYMGDTARLPYGTKSQDTIVRYAVQAASCLVERGIKMLVIACGTASSAALPVLRDTFAPLPVIGVIEPGAAAAVAASKQKHVVVIATEASIRGKAYEKAMQSHDPQIRVTGRPCTLFVALAEEGWTSGPLVEGVASRYLSELFTPGQPPAAGQNPPPNSPTATPSATPDTLLLGCTHFPPLREALQKVVGPEVTLVDSASTTAEAVRRSLHSSGMAATATQQGHCHFLTTDDVARFQRTGSLFFGAPLPLEHIELIDL